jgi:S-adenosylmethionine synthetase
VMGDRAAVGLAEKKLPIKEIAIGAARDWFKQNLRHVDPDTHVEYQIELKPTSAELGAIFEPRRGLLVANDTSAGVGYAPLTPIERLVIDVEHYLNGPLFKAEFPETGEDIKIMAIRLRDQLSLTLAVPLLAAAVPNAAAYFRQKSRIIQAIQEFVRKRPHGCKKIRIVVNALDRKGKGLAGMYLTLLGTSAEHGDSGQIGRGNRVCGVIPLSRPTSGEAAAGKNPVSHVGKIYNVLAQELASRIHQQVPGVRTATVQLCSTIGQRIDRPAIAVAELSLGKGVSLPRVQKRVRTIIQDGLKGLGPFCEALARGRYQVF